MSTRDRDAEFAKLLRKLGLTPAANDNDPDFVDAATLEEKVVVSGPGLTVELEFVSAVLNAGNDRPTIRGFVTFEELGRALDNYDGPRE
jgi:hypothetical protein